LFPLGQDSNRQRNPEPTRKIPNPEVRSPQPTDKTETVRMVEERGNNLLCPENPQAPSHRWRRHLPLAGPAPFGWGFHKKCFAVGGSAPPPPGPARTPKTELDRRFPLHTAVPSVGSDPRKPSTWGKNGLPSGRCFRGRACSPHALSAAVYPPAQIRFFFSGGRPEDPHCFSVKPPSRARGVCAKMTRFFPGPDKSPKAAKPKGWRPPRTALRGQSPGPASMVDGPTRPEKAKTSMAAVSNLDSVAD